MKTSRPSLRHAVTLLSIPALLLAFTGNAGAQTTLTKANNTTVLNASGSWVGSPTLLNNGTETAKWDSTVTAANSSALGGGYRFAGIVIANPGGAITIANTAGATLTNGAGGVDMSTATANLTINPSINIGANQTWTVAGGLTLAGIAGAGTSSGSGAGNINMIQAGAGTANITFNQNGNVASGQTGWSSYSGAITVNSNVKVISQGNDKAAFGSGTITLAGGQISQNNGSWAFGNNIDATAASTIGQDSSNGNGRVLKLLGNLTSANGSGLTFQNNVVAGTRTDDSGFLLAGAAASTYTTTTISANSRVRVGGEATAALSGTGNNAGTRGFLGTGIVTLADPTAELAFTHTDSIIVANKITGSGTVQIGGTTTAQLGTSNQVVTFTATNDYTGNTAIKSGTFIIGGSGQLGSGSYAGNITNNGAFIYNSTATQTVNGTLSGTGSMTVSAGTLNVSGTISGPLTNMSGATLMVGGVSIGTLTVNNSVTLQSGSTNVMRINKSGANLTADNIAGTGNVTFGGTLVVTATGDALAAGDSFTLFAKGSYSGSFAATNLPALAGPLAWNLSPLTVNGTIQVYNTNQAATPFFSPVAGGYLSPQSVTITSAGATTIYYTTNGWAATNVYSTPVALPASTAGITIQAYAVKSGFAASGVSSATYSTIVVPTWGQPAGGSWANATDWSNGIVANLKGITADFSALTLTANATVTLDSAPTVGSLIFADQGTNYSWDLESGTGGSLTLDSASGISTISVSNTTTIIGAVLAGTNSLTKTGNGTLTLTPANTYSGGTTISSGTLQVANGSGTTARAGSGGIQVDAAGTLAFNYGGAVNAFANNISGAGTVNKSGGTDLGLIGTNAFSGQVNINAGKLAFEGAHSGDGAPKVNIGASGTMCPGTGYNGATLSIAELAGAGTISGTFGSSGAARTLNVNQTSNTTFSGTIADGGARVIALTKSGVGTLTLAGANTYTGPTTINDGILEIASTGSLAATAVTVNSNATLAASGTLGGSVTVQSGGHLVPTTVTTATALGTPLFISGNLALNGTVTLRITKDGGNLSYDSISDSGLGGVTYGGTLVVTNVTTDTNILAAGDSFNLFSGQLNGTFASYVLPALPGGLSWDVSGLASAGSIAVISGTPTALVPSFTPPAGGYIGAQTVTISSANLSATTTIHYSTDNVNWSSHTSPATVVVPVNTNETIYAYATAPGYLQSATVSAAYSTLDKATWISAFDGSWSGALNWSNNVMPNVNGALADFNTLTLPTASINVTLDMAATVGQLLFGDLGNAYGWNLTNNPGISLTLNNGAATPVVNVVNQTATIGATLAGTNGLTKTGNGTLALATGNTYSGSTTVAAGKLSLGGSSAVVAGTGAIQVDATLEFNNSGAVNAFANSLNGAGTVEKTSATDLGLTGTNAFSGQVNINAGKLAFEGAHSGDGAPKVNIGTNGTMCPGTGYNGATLSIAELAGAGTISGTFGSSGAARTLNVNQTSTTTFSGTIADGGARVIALTKSGAGTLTLAGANTYTGATTLSNGTLVVNGSLAAGSTVIVESGATLVGIGTIAGVVTNNGTLLAGTNGVGTLTVNGSLTLGSTSTGTFAVNGTSGINTIVALGSTVAYGGTLNIVPTGTFTAGQSFTLFSGAGATNAGNFSSLTGSPGSGKAFLFTNGVLTVVSTTVPSAFLTNSVSGGTLTLSWPAGQGWRLEGQTNSRSVGLSTNWVPLTDSSVNSTNITIDKAKPTLFYRLVNP